MVTVSCVPRHQNPCRMSRLVNWLRDFVVTIFLEGLRFSQKNVKITKSTRDRSQESTRFTFGPEIRLERCLAVRMVTISYVPIHQNPPETGWIVCWLRDFAFLNRPSIVRFFLGKSTWLFSYNIVDSIRIRSVLRSKKSTSSSKNRT